MRRGARRGRAGFTLIELTIAVVLLAVGLLALVGALARALQETQAARQRHAVLRHVEGIADSLAIAGSAGSGARDVAGYRVDWRPEACVAGTCVRIRVRHDARENQGFDVLARVADAPERP